MAMPGRGGILTCHIESMEMLYAIYPLLPMARCLCPLSEYRNWVMKFLLP